MPDNIDLNEDIARCPNGHYYERKKHITCPYCGPAEEPSSQSNPAEIIMRPASSVTDSAKGKTEIILPTENTNKQDQETNGKTELPNNIVPSMQSPVESSSNKCSNCGAEIIENASFCSKCGRPIEAEKTCSKCGAKIRKGNAFCINCGAPVETPESSATIAKPITVKKQGISFRKEIIIGVILVVFITSIIGLCLSIPRIKYASAERDLKQNNFDAAYKTFVSIGKQEKAKETIYLKGQYLIEKEEYLEAAEEFDRILDYQDSKKKAEDCRKKASYLDGIENYKNGEYDEALSIFRKLGNYLDTEEWLKKTQYANAIEYCNNGKYVNAVDVFDKLGDYEDSINKANEARYAYVKSHELNSNRTTYSYLQELIANNYLDSQSIYDELYRWEATVIVNNSKTDETSDYTSLSKYDTIYVHVKLSGGAPNERVKLKYTYAWPGSKSETDEWDSEWQDGSSSWFSTWLNTPAYGNTGSFSFSVNTIDDKYLASGVIHITN